MRTVVMRQICRLGQGTTWEDVRRREVKWSKRAFNARRELLTRSHLDPRVTIISHDSSKECEDKILLRCT